MAYRWKGSSPIFRQQHLAVFRQPFGKAIRAAVSGSHSSDAFDLSLRWAKSRLPFRGAGSSRREAAPGADRIFHVIKGTEQNAPRRRTAY